MLRVCRKCRIEYDGAPGSTLCPSCVREGRKTSIRDRTCRACGATFPGGPRAWYCPRCRRERKRIQKNQANARARSGTTRKLGSEDCCIVCGDLYIVKSGNQHYCPNCAVEAVRVIDRQQSKDWNAANTTPEGRRELRQAQTAELLCIVCGKPYAPNSKSLSCSPECAAEYHHRKRRAWEAENAAALNAYQRSRRTKKLAAMTPEERAAYREKVNAKARENYHKRKSKKEA